MRVQVRSALWKYNRGKLGVILPQTVKILLQSGLVPCGICAVVKIEQRLDRVRLGNLGNSKSVGEGVCELKIDFGPGYRVYFGQLGSTIVLLICGGDKSTQEQDIRKAYEYWKEYGERENANER